MVSIIYYWQDDDYKKAVDIFKNKLNELPHFDKTNLENNLKTLKIKELTNKRRLFENSFYDYELNTIEISKLEMYDSIFHELFHSSSYVKNKNVYHLGFCEELDDSKFGSALNEGYTEYLVRKYFEEFDVSDVYELEVIFASFLEHIVGNTIMEYLYSKGDLSGLIKEILKYNREDNIIDFIMNLDYILKLENEYNKSRKIKKLALSCVKFLIECYTNKLRILKEEMIEIKVRIYAYNLLERLECLDYYKRQEELYGVDTLKLNKKTL